MLYHHRITRGKGGRASISGGEEKGKDALPARARRSPLSWCAGVEDDTTEAYRRAGRERTIRRRRSFLFSSEPEKKACHRGKKSSASRGRPGGVRKEAKRGVEPFLLPCLKGGKIREDNYNRKEISCFCEGRSRKREFSSTREGGRIHSYDAGRRGFLAHRGGAILPFRRKRLRPKEKEYSTITLKRSQATTPSSSGIRGRGGLTEFFELKSLQTVNSSVYVSTNLRARRRGGPKKAVPAREGRV